MPSPKADMRARILDQLLRQVPVGEAFPDVRAIEVLPAEAFPPLELPANHLADEARYLAVEGNRTPDMFACVLPGGLYDAQLNLLLARRGRILSDAENVWREFPGTPAHERYYWRFQYTKARRRIRGGCMALRSPANNYYHTLIDNLPRLFWLHQPCFRGTPVTLMVPGPLRPWERYFLPHLLPDGARLAEVDACCLWAPDEMIFGSYLSRQMSGALPRAYLNFFLPRVLPQRPRERRLRLYVTRKQAPGGRRILNEAELLHLLQARGFTVHTLESLDIDTQIDLFYDAEIVVAAHGAGLTNILFGENLTVIELHPTPAIMPHYYFMARAMGHRYCHLCAGEAHRHSSFSVDCQALAALLDDID